MKRRLAIAVGIFSFLAVLAVFGYLRLRQGPKSGRQPTATALVTELPALTPPSTGTSASELEKLERERLERAQMEKARQESALQIARQEAEKRAAESQAARRPPAPAQTQPPSSALQPTVPVVTSSPAPSAAAPADASILNRKSGGGITAPTPGASPAGVSSLEEVDAALKKLDWGQMAFDVPEKLRLEQTALIHLLISPAQTAEQLTAAIREQTSEPVKIESARIQISGLMEAKLVGSAFDIRSITPEEPQMVSRTEPTEWKWEIRPRESGRLSLHLTLNAIIRFEDQERPRVVRTFDRVIPVDVAAAGDTARRVLPAAAFAAVLVALGSGSWLFYRTRQKRKRIALARSIAPMEATGRDAALDLFLSYSRRDEKRVLPIAERLRAAGLSVWIDQGGIDGATLWAQEITDAIRRAKVCVLFGSVSSFGSPHVIREVSLACEERKPILPLQLDPVETPSAMRYQLAGIQHIVLYQGDPEANFQLILRALTRLGARAE
jgi:hypothetical protein